MPAGVTAVIASGQGFLPEAPAPQPTETHPVDLPRPARPRNWQQKYGLQFWRARCRRDQHATPTTATEPLPPQPSMVASTHARATPLERRRRPPAQGRRPGIRSPHRGRKPQRSLLPQAAGHRSKRRLQRRRLGQVDPGAAILHLHTVRGASAQIPAAPFTGDVRQAQRRLWGRRGGGSG
jgi:hypothetical protein